MLDSWQSVLRCCARLLLVSGAVSYSALAPALGLGDITLHSALNQPLRADIALLDTAGLEEGELSVSLATADEFSRAGVERVFFLNDLKFTPILRGNRSLIRVSSSKPVNEPFLNFLVQLKQPNGRLLREYTVLVDPPGSPGIVPVTDEPVARSRDSAFPSVEPAVASAPASKDKKPTSLKADPPAAAPVDDPLAEQLAASVLQNQQLQTTLDELKAKVQSQDEQIAGQKKQVSELQTQLAEVKQAPPVVPAPVVAPPAAVVEASEASNWPVIFGMLALLIAVLLGLFVRRRRQQVLALPEPSAELPARHEPVLTRPAPAVSSTPAVQSTPEPREAAPAGDVLEGVGIYLAYGRFSEAAGLLREALIKEPQRTDLAVQLLEVLGQQADVPAYETQETLLREAGFDAQKLQEIRARYPKLSSAAPLVAAVAIVPPAAAAIEPPSGDEFQLNLDDLSMDSNWDLVSPFENTPPAAKPSSEPAPVESPFTSNLHVLPDVFEMPDQPTLDESELEWVPEPDSQSLDDSFLNEFGDPGESLELEPLSLAPNEPGSAGKLEQAQNCIDDGDRDSAIELLNELLKEGNEPLKQTARNLLAGLS